MKNNIVLLYKEINEIKLTDRENIWRWRLQDQNVITDITRIASPLNSRLELKKETGTETIIKR